jgi:hypothetical protein
VTPCLGLECLQAATKKTRVRLAAANRHRQLEAVRTSGVPAPHERVEAKWQMGHHRRNVERLRQRHGTPQTAQRIVRPTGRIEGEERAVQRDDGQIVAAGQPAQIIWMAGVPALIDQDLNPVVAGAGGEIEDAHGAIAVERAGRKRDQRHPSPLRRLRTTLLCELISSRYEHHRPETCPQTFARVLMPTPPGHPSGPVKHQSRPAKNREKPHRNPPRR